ncbi:Diguanylate cyclase/phosphodiesterase with PAS/PAC sensor(S) [Rhodospirillaceae bacterium LM-1]|nr:Diguanylate cyclase/phosphodiesterase with PAS/PAC sensor(S) [Rhodospirillaceae bacterium LM-1]
MEMTISPIRLGLMPPLSGLVEMYGQEIVWAATIACAEINESGGILGRPLELVVEDDGSLPQTAVPAARRLIELHKCCAIIGNLLSNARIDVAAKVADPLGVPYLNFSFYEGSISSRWFFHFAALPNQQIDKMIPFMGERYGLKMFFAGNNYEWPRGSIDACKRSLAAANGEIVGEEYLPLGARSEEIEVLLERVARSGADVLVPYFAGADQIALLSRFAEMGIKSRMAVVMGHFDEIIASRLTPEAREGLYSSNTYFMSVEKPESRAYLTKLGQLPGVSGLWPSGNGVLTNFGEGTYVCVKAFAEAARRAGSVDPAPLAAALETVSVLAPQGEVRMDAHCHHATVNSYLTRCRKDGTFEIIKAFGPIAPQIPERYRSSPGAPHFTESPPSPQVAARLASEAAEAYRRTGTAKQILALADIAILACDQNGFITDANRTVCEMFGYAEGELTGLSIHLLVPPNVRTMHQEHQAVFLASDETERRMGQRKEITGYRKDGTFFPLEASIAKFHSDDAWVLVATLRDLTAVKETEEELTRRATHDALTGLPNRALIHERLEKALRRTKERSDSIALLFIDLDGFKDVNDKFGHEAGDHLLKEFSKRLIHLVRPGDTVGRLAGDEFVILCEHVDTPSRLSALAERVLSAAKQQVIYGSEKLFVTASIGIAVGHGSTHAADDLIRAADTAMYSVKESGRAGWRFFNEGLQVEAQRRLSISHGLRSALVKNELYVVYQPIVDTSSSVVVGAELLLRWRSDEGEISPAVFIPIAEMNGSIVDIGYWVFEEACRTERHWHAQAGEDAPYVSFNMSTRQMEDPALVNRLLSIIAETGADPRRLLLEITETSLMADPDANRDIIDRMAGLGMRIAVDDFGTGYSSLLQLLRLKIDVLKIDKEFIQGISTNPDSDVIVSTLCRMSKSLNLSLVAEGVETQDQRNALRALGCNSIQGYLFYRPMPANELLIAAANSRRATERDGRNLCFLIYASRPATEVTPSLLNAIVTKARAFNQLNGISGHLIHFDGAFVQYIEGEETGIRRLYAMIRDDPRHRDVTLVTEGTLVRRLFAGWTMGVSGLDASSHFNDPGDNASVFDVLTAAPVACRSLFEAVAMDER